MRSASSAFANVVGGSHRMASRVDVLFDRAVIYEGLDVVSGTITYDRTAARLARLSLEVAEPTRIPVDSTDILTPFGYELLVWRGVEYVAPDGSDAYFSLTTNDYLSTPDSAALDTLTDDLEIVVRMSMPTWSGGGSGMTVVSKGGRVTAPGWELYWYLTSCYLRIGSTNQGSCTAANLGLTAGVTYWIRVTRDAGTGAIDWYVEPDSLHPPTSWGTAKTDGGTQASGAIPANDRSLAIGAINTTGTTFGSFLTGDVYDVIVGDGTSTVFEMRSYQLAADSFQDFTGQTVTVNGATLIPAGIEETVELLPMGVFPIQTSQVDGSTMVTSITAEDRSRLVSDSRFEDDYQIPAGTNFATAIETMIDYGVPDLEYNFASTAYTTPLLTFAAQSDRWEAAQEMARSIGYEIYFDGLGVCTMTPEPTFSDTPVASISEGVNMVDLSSSLDRTTAYNRVIASSSNSSTGDVYRGVATDDDSQSPTNYSGPFGAKPMFWSSSYIASDTQAAEAAAAILASNLGVARAVDFSAVPDPRLECSDVVQITRTQLGIDDLHIIETLSLGLGADASMSGTTRTQQAL